MTPIERHLAAGGKPVLQFSGGKDSLACLELLRPHWDRLTVAWANTGDAFSETVAVMEAVRPKVMEFIEIKTDAPAQIAAKGWPVDVLPVSRTPYGRSLAGGNAQLMQAYTVCCWENIWLPMAAKMEEIGATLIIRGQRNSEAMKSPIRSGADVGGIEYWFPIEDWSESDVFAFLRERGVPVPAYYEHTGSGLDCIHCTAWMQSQGKVIGWMKDAHPAAHAEVRRRLVDIAAAVRDEAAVLEAVA